MALLTDLLRLLTVAVGMVDLGLTVAVFQMYFKANRLNQISRQQELGKFVGALPRHIIAVSAAHALMILGICGVVIAKLGDAFTLWPTVVALPAFCLSLFGQFEMLTFQQRRVDLVTGHIMVIDPGEGGEKR